MSSRFKKKKKAAVVLTPEVKAAAAAMLKKGENLSKSVDDVISAVRAKYGQHAILRANEAKFLTVVREPTGIAALDFALGGGFPRGRYVHIFGREQAGKTFVAMHTIATMQRRYPNGLAVWLDIEQVFDEARARKIGIDLNRLIVIREASIEAALRLAEEFIEVQEVRIFVVDSVAAIVTAAEMEGDVEDQTMGQAPRLLNRFVRRWIAKGSPKDNVPLHSFVILLNQLREKIVKGFSGPLPPKPQPPGGRGLRFFASIEVELARGDTIDLSTREDDNERTVVGFEAKAKIVKNNTFPPERVGQFMICVRPFTVGDYKLKPHSVDNPADILRYAVRHDIVKQGGAWYTYGDKKWNGNLAARAALAQNPELMQELSEKVMASIYEKLGITEAKATEEKPKTGAAGLREKLGKKAAGQR